MLLALLLAACARPDGDTKPSDAAVDDTAADTDPGDTDPADTADTDDTDVVDDTADTDPGDTDDTGPAPIGCAAEPDPDAACDDGDACTTDTCDRATGVCASAGFDGDPLDLWDLSVLGDPTTLDLEVIGTETVLEGLTLVEVSEIRYTSWEYEGCEMRPVRIEAYVGVPLDVSTPAPGLVVAHGLGGSADADNASTPAAELGVVALAYSGPGQGASEGTGSDPDHLFDTARDPRNSWFWEHAAAAIRGLTVLESLSDVDASRLAMTGYSGGAVATWMVAGVDSRLTAAFPVSATGYLDLAIAATPNPGWEYDLLQAMATPKTAADAEWVNYQRWLDPKNYLGTLHAPVMLVNGAQDEFFPVTSTYATMVDARAVQPDSRLLLVPNWDHGWYAYFTGDEAAELGTEALGMWMGHHLGTDRAYADAPPTPQVDSVTPWTCYDPDYPWILWTCSAVVTNVPDLAGWDITSATFWFSVDNALTFTSWNLEEYSGGVWYAEVGTLDGNVYTSANTVWFVSYELSGGWAGPTFTVTSLPNVPAGFSPYILPVDGPLP